MRVNTYFNPVDAEVLGLSTQGDDSLGATIRLNAVANELDGNLDALSCDMALIGVGTKTSNGRFYHADAIRKRFYELKPHRKAVRIADLGNLKGATTQAETLEQLSQVCVELLRARVIPIILSTDNLFAAAGYMAYEKIGQIINIFNLDSKIDFDETSTEMTSDNYLAYLFCKQPNYLFNYTHTAYQSYLVKPDLVDLMQQMRFETYRLGEVHNRIEQTEPLVRNADMVIADISVLRGSDSPCSDNPHGLYGEEFCKILNFAGMSDKLSCLGIYGYNSSSDDRLRTAGLISHALWYFIEGYNWRKQDYPYRDRQSYYKFNVVMPNDTTIVFFKSKKSERWWMQVSCTEQMREKYLRHFLVPCLYEDYTEAMQGRVPLRWISAYNKLNL